MYENTSLIPHDPELHDMKFLPSHPYVIQSNHRMVLESRTLRASAHPAQICKPQHWGNTCYVTMIHPRGVMLSAAHVPHLNPQGQLIFYPSAMFFVWVQELNRTTHGSFFRREMRGIKFLKIFGHSFQWSIHSIWMCFFDQCSKFASFWCCRIRDLEIYGTLSTIYCHSNTIYATFEGAFTQGAFQGIGSCC